MFTRVRLLRLKPALVQDTYSVLGREEGYPVKYVPQPKGFPEGTARGKF